MNKRYKDLLAIAEIYTKEMEGKVQIILAQKEQRRRVQEIREQKQRNLEHKSRLRFFADQKKRKEDAGQKDECVVRETVFVQRATALQPEDAIQPEKKTTAVKAQKADILEQEQEQCNRRIELRETSTPSSPGAETRICHGKVANVPAAAPTEITSASGNLKDHLATMANTCVRLNVVKRDIRTIDEIVRDRQRHKGVLDGDRARSFDDWFMLSKARSLKKRPRSAASRRMAVDIPPSGASPTPGH
ncbi:hypothetical protein C8R46DRAFT_1030602 [Mycena filopes]|nr:hypothetical protein C8R46DRAFT_1030602 [Mycena filopes]